MMQKKKRRVIFGILVLSAVVFWVLSKNQAGKSDPVLRAAILSEEYQMDEEDNGIITYEQYYAMHGAAGALSENGTEIMVSGNDYSSSSFDTLPIDENGRVITGKEGSISYSFDVADAGSYYIEVGYFPSAEGTGQIQRSLSINGEQPFLEAGNMVFERMWQDASKSYLMVSDQNQSVPSQVQNPQWTQKRLECADKTTAGPFVFFFEKGRNILTFTSNGGMLGISHIKLVPAEGLESYFEYVDRLKSLGAEIISIERMGGAVEIQAEDAYAKTSSILVPVNDRTSPLSVPYHPSNIVLNTIGGAAWEKAGQGITWEVNVPERGFYQIASRYMQAENRDFYSNREIKINGNVPFMEASSVRFTYGSSFQNGYLGDGITPYYFYLEEGKNTITFTVTMGDLSYAYLETRKSIQNFNELYRRFTSVMGSDPDVFRDYNITANIPDMVDILKREYYRLFMVMESLGEDFGQNAKTKEISKMLLQVEGLIKKPDTAARELQFFNSNLTAISDWVHSLGSQPLKLDYLIVCGEGYELPKAEGNFLQNAGHTIRSFFGSFTNDYSTDTEEDEKNREKVTVWIAASTRDQYDVAQRFVNQAFADSGILVSLQMVNADTVTPSTLTGNGPDVALQLNYTMPANFAFRNAAYDLTQFADFDDIASQFSNGAMEFFEYEGGYYALPDQMSYPVLYYRTDILEELGLSVPETWEEFTDLIPYLQSENMQPYFLTTQHTILGGSSSTVTKPVNAVFLSMLYQNGIELYAQDGRTVNLGSHEAMMVFKNWTEYYTKQGFPELINVVTRFRTGETPILIEDYTYMNVLKAAAPEIEGSWTIAPIPGTMADGELKRTSSCMVSGAMIIKPGVEAHGNAGAAWEFLKWWVSEETQFAYAQELEAILGPAAEFPAANLNALRAMSEEAGILGTIETVIENLRGIPQKPGGYIVGRNIENAWFSVVSSNVDPVDTIFSQINSMNTEIELKRNEFGLEE